MTKAVHEKRLESSRTCNFCGASVSFGQKKKHVTERHKEVQFETTKSNELKCTRCDKIFGNWGALARHYESEHTTLYQEMRQAPKEGEKAGLSHSLRKGKTSTKCPVCDKDIKLGKKISHFSKEHPELKFRMDNQKHIVCVTCDPNKMVGSWKELVSHYALRHKKGQAPILHAKPIATEAPKVTSEMKAEVAKPLEDRQNGAKETRIGFDISFSFNVDEGIGKRLGTIGEAIEMILTFMALRYSDDAKTNDEAMAQIRELESELHDALSSLENTNQLREKISRGEAILAKVAEERDRAIKIHNEQVTKGQLSGKRITLDSVRKSLHGSTF